MLFFYYFSSSHKYPYIDFKKGKPKKILNKLGESQITLFEWIVKYKGVASIKKLVQFLKDVKSEMTKVKWASKKEVTKNTLSVLFVVLIISSFFFGVDLLITYSEKLFFN